jgi:hypothetical protein
MPDSVDPDSLWATVETLLGFLFNQWLVLGRVSRDWAFLNPDERELVDRQYDRFRLFLRDFTTFKGIKLVWWSRYLPGDVARQPDRKH